MNTYDPRNDGARCEACPRFNKRAPVPSECRSPPARAAWLGQDPGAEETKQGRPYVGKTGILTTELWEKSFRARGVAPWPRESLAIINASACQPLNAQSEKEAATAATLCRPRALRDIIRLAPNAPVLAMGKWAWFALKGETAGAGPYQGFHVLLSADYYEAELTRAEKKANELAAKLLAKKVEEKEDDEDEIPF